MPSDAWTELPRPDSEALAIAHAFLQVYHADRLADRVRTLDEYRALYPGYEYVIDEEHAAVTAADDDPEPLDDDREIGPYRIAEEIASGGMGTVYRARQRGALERDVAVKLIKLGMDTREIIRRFNTERRALGLMNHPNIARVFDAGATQRGRPYFVMEFVEGDWLTRYCDRERATIRERLELFAKVCDGVQHAHQKGIIHRDLKPSNVLVMSVNGRPMPKIIDFGLARAIEPDLAETLALTGSGQLIGTPEYMSPEQADDDGDVDTRADVYALGVILYELVTGRTPFTRDLRSGDPAEVLRRIREFSPLRPSSLVGKDPERLSESAGARRITERELVGILRGDLDWIVLKAMSNDRDQRYATAAELRDDIGRYLDGRSVEARPPSRVYTLTKFVRRNRLMVGASTAVLLALIGGLVTSLVFERRARLNERQALTNLSEYNVLSMVMDLEEFEEHAERLYPAWPSVERGLEEWFRNREYLIDHLPELEKVHDAIRNRAVDPAAAELEFPSNRDAFLMREVIGLIDRLRELEDDDHELVASVRARLAWARQVRERSIDAHRDGWERAREAVRRDARFDGLELQPRMGLVPLGPDPDSDLQEFLHLASHDGEVIPVRDPRGRLALEERSGIVFVLLPGGAATVGAQRDDPGSRHFDPYLRPGERPPTDIHLEPFFVAKFEVTAAQVLRLTGDLTNFWRPGDNPGDVEITLRHPAERVNWVTALQLCRQLGLELPTEDQWEYAYRAGGDQPWYFGTDPNRLPRYGNVADRAARAWAPQFGVFEEFDDGRACHAPVGSYLPNRFGLHDMAGNVAEWCRNPFGPQLPNQRAIRGGSYGLPAVTTRATFRHPAETSDKTPFVGFRPVRELR